MSIFKHENDSITIGGLVIPLKLFLVLEPNYKYPNDLVVMVYDGKSRNYRTKNKSWTIEGRWSDGDRYAARSSDFSQFMKIMDGEDMRAKIDFKKAISPSSELRKTEYPSIESLVVALWEKVVENRDDAANALQAQREVIKAKYPLEEPVNVELHQRSDINEGGTEGVRPKSKRTPRSRSKHSG